MIKNEILTKFQLMVYDYRVNQIIELIDQCGPNDDDVLINLERELEEIKAILEKSIAAIQRSNGRLKLVK